MECFCFGYFQDGLALEIKKNGKISKRGMKIGKEEVFEFIKSRTYRKLDEGKQIKLTAQEILENLDINEGTLYKNLKGIRCWPDVKVDTYKIRRFKEGRKIYFEQDYWWII